MLIYTPKRIHFSRADAYEMRVQLAILDWVMAFNHEYSFLFYINQYWNNRKVTVCYCSYANSLAVVVMVDTGGSISYPIYRMVVVLFRYGVLTYQAPSQCLKKFNTEIYMSSESIAFLLDGIVMNYL